MKVVVGVVRAELTGTYDPITAFDVIHDLVRPARRPGTGAETVPSAAQCIAEDARSDALAARYEASAEAAGASGSPFGSEF
ncbi:hypothetical protein ACFXJ5_04100 [Streptomyces sp. NPDC059373]